MRGQVDKIKGMNLSIFTITWDLHYFQSSKIVTFIFSFL